MSDTEAMKVIEQKLDKEFREQIATQIMRCEVGGFDWPDGRKAGLIRKTRSKVSPYVATRYGRLIMQTTKVGSTYLGLGKL